MTAISRVAKGKMQYQDGRAPRAGKEVMQRQEQINVLWMTVSARKLSRSKDVLIESCGGECSTAKASMLLA